MDIDGNKKKQFIWFNVKYLAKVHFLHIPSSIADPIYIFLCLILGRTVVSYKINIMVFILRLLIIVDKLYKRLILNFLFHSRDSEIYIKYYMNIFQTMVLGVLPFCALIFFNIKIYHRFMVTRSRFQARGSRGSTQVSML